MRIANLALFLELFNLAYSNGVLLTGTDWHQSLLEKIKEDNEVFYKNYDAFKIWISFDEETSNSKILKEPMKTFYKYFAHQREKITPSERKTLVCLYKKEETMRKNILFDILYDLLNYEINM